MTIYYSDKKTRTFSTFELHVVHDNQISWFLYHSRLIASLEPAPNITTGSTIKSIKSMQVYKKKINIRNNYIKNLLLGDNLVSLGRFYRL